MIQRHRINPIGGLVNVADFNDMSPDMRRVVTGATVRWRWSLTPGAADDPSVHADFRTTGAPSRPYAAAFNLLIEEALARTPDGAKVHFTFDRHNVYEGFARLTYAEMIKQQVPGWEKLGDLIYAASDDHDPLQVADLYAYIITNWMTRQGAVTPDRFQAAQVFFEKRKRIRVQNTASFENLLEEMDTEVMNAIVPEMLR